MTTETELMPECGRLVFRGVELAYLNINGKKMLPLAEMLALVFRSTPRTTLFTRMEKIKAQRYFCQPLEIKMLKKVNGIHGSSANCTLIPEEDVERYCSIYMDRNPDGLAYSAGPRELGEVARTDEQFKAVETNDNANLGKESKIAAHRGKPANFVMRATEFGAHEINTTEMSSRNTQAASSNKRERNSDAVNDDGGNLTSPLSLDQEHTSNSTQTISMLSWSTKKQAANIVDDLEVNKNAKTKRTKKRNRAVGAGKKFNSPSDEHKKFPRKGEISQRSTSTTGKSPKLRKRRNLTLNLDSGFSDDSGFTSLTFEDYISPSKVQKLETQEKLKIVDEVSPLGPKKQRKKKKKKSGVGLTDDLNLSPPPLVIKKLQNTWQVETKLDGVKKSLYKPTNEEEKSLLPVNGVVGKHSSAKAQSPKKKKQQRKLPAGSDVQCTAAAASRTNQGKKNRRPGPRNVADACAGVPEQECLTTPEKKKKVLKNGAKKLKVAGRLESLNTTSASQAVTQGPSSVSKPLKHAAPAGTKLTPVKPPVLRATPNFSFMDLFPSTCRLVIRDGDVCPEFTMACPSDVAKPHPSHPVWRWRLGGPVIAKTHRVSFRIRKIKQPNKPAVSDGSQAKASGLSRTAPLP